MCMCRRSLSTPLSASGSHKSLHQLILALALPARYDPMAPAPLKAMSAAAEPTSLNGLHSANGVPNGYSALKHGTTPPVTLSAGTAPSLVDAPLRTAFAFDPIEDALAAFARGEFLVVVDDENRENEGDLIMSGSLVTTQQMAWMIKYTSGYICLSLPSERLEELHVPMMVPNNTERHRTAYTITADYKHGTSTGISAHDRALTTRQLSTPSLGATPEDFTRPGHMVPLRARSGGVLERRGHTEAGVDLCRLTGQPAAGLLCELVNDDAEGTMARRDDCRAFADRWGLKMISIDQLVEHRRQIGGQEGAVAEA
ncbi:GTP cyclohydrolase II [Auriculariales sp. MPI-PUGE-AT-0066]|nr:GTP cyclohydrolase II [Auriculariales sp. MPI-PUGE-AT-0066]